MAHCSVWNEVNDDNREGVQKCEETGVQEGELFGVTYVTNRKLNRKTLGAYLTTSIRDSKRVCTCASTKFKETTQETRISLGPGFYVQPVTQDT